MTRAYYKNQQDSTFCRLKIAKVKDFTLNRQPSGTMLHSGSNLENGNSVHHFQPFRNAECSATARKMQNGAATALIGSRT